MADYYPLLARALEALPDRTPALRKAVYDRARTALLGQLRSLDPPVSEADIDLERQALDAAIARLEAGYDDAPRPVRKAGAEPFPPIPKPEPVRSAQNKPAQDKPAPARPESKPPGGATPTGTARPVAKPADTPPETTAPAAKPAAKPSEPAPPAALLPQASLEASPEASPLPSAQPLDLTKPPEAREPEVGPVPEFVPFVPPTRRRADPPPAQDEPAEPAAPAEPGFAEPLPVPPENGTAKRPRLDVVAPRANRSRLLRNVLVGTLLALVIGLIAVAAFLLRDKPSDLSENAGVEEGAPAEQAEQKLSDRVGGETAQPAAPPAGAASQTDVTVAQRAVLYEENNDDPRAQPKATGGRAIWRLDAVNGEQGQPLQSVARANLDFPDVGVALAMTIRKNLDASLPASHTIELAFSLTGPSQDRAVQEIGLLQLKDDQNARGSSVSGLPVRVRDNLFLIGLSNLPSDIDRNRDLLTRRSWMDLAIKFKSGQRAVVVFDKGPAGAQVLQSAFDQWRD